MAPDSELNLLAHAWIKNELEQSIRNGTNWAGSMAVENEEQVVLRMLELSDQRNSFEDIWKVRVGNVSVFQYHSTLATWHFGLNLVRFEQSASRGRTLEII